MGCSGTSRPFQTQYDVLWDRFDQHFGVHAGVDPSSWPAITELAPSVTFDLSAIPDGPQRGAAYDAVNAEALRAFVWSFADAPELSLLTGSTRLTSSGRRARPPPGRPSGRSPCIPTVTTSPS